MSSKSFFVLEVVDGKPGKLYERETFELALDLAVVFAKEQTDVPEANIREEIEADTDFISPDGAIQICILQTEDD